MKVDAKLSKSRSFPLLVNILPYIVDAEFLKLHIRIDLHMLNLLAWFCDNVWTFILQDAVFKNEDGQENAGQVKIVACDSKLLNQRVGDPCQSQAVRAHHCGWLNTLIEPSLAFAWPREINLFISSCPSGMHKPQSTGQSEPVIGPFFPSEQERRLPEKGKGKREGMSSVYLLISWDTLSSFSSGFSLIFI
ncbi:Transcription initiation factor IIA, gamma subunit, C-terminal [Dillenia turbinata]|uniref:Transcription initiation factor IIA, gamma subunit, C-terminal n=1 Tax=Dillenia turbinata TaxID=194707 RepID=A0AAN8ZDQ3_9MAGN